MDVDSEKEELRFMEELHYYLTEMGITTERARTLLRRGRYQEVSVGHIKFEMPIRVSSGDVKQILGDEVKLLGKKSRPVTQIFGPLAYAVDNISNHQTRWDDVGNEYRQKR